MLKRFNWSSSTAQRNCLIWFNDFPSINSLMIASVSHIAVSELSQSTSDCDTKVQRCLTKGTFQSRHKFYVYRTLVYNVHLNSRSFLFPRRSVGGFYLRRLGLPNYRRIFTSSVINVVITPHGVSTKLLFDFMNKDILNSCIREVEKVDVNGDECRISLWK